MDFQWGGVSVIIGLALLLSLLMFVVAAYSPSVTLIVARLPVIGPSEEDYRTPDKSESERFQNLPVTPDCDTDLFIDQTGTAPSGEASGVSIEIPGIGVFGSAAIRLNEAAFKKSNSRLAELVAHECGHLHNDQIMNVTYVVVFVFLMAYTILGIIGGIVFNSGAIFLSAFISCAGVFLLLGRYLSLSREAEYDADEFAARQLDSPDRVIEWLKSLKGSESNDKESEFLWNRFRGFVSRYWDQFWDRYFGSTHPTPDDRINELRDRFGIDVEKTPPSERPPDDLSQ